MENIWLMSALWVGLALMATLISIRLAVSVALIEIMVGALGGNLLGLAPNEWVNYLAGMGAILLTFLAGAELDPAIIRRNLWSTMSIGAVGFFAPYLGVLAYTVYVLGWPLPQAQIAAIALSTTSVAVVYAVMVETGFNRTEIGKIILAGCFVNDVGTVLALGIVFANYNLWLAAFGALTAVALWLLPRFVPWFFNRVGERVSEPEIKFILLVLFVLGGVGAKANSEAVLPAYLVGMVLAPYFLKNRDVAHRVRTIAFTILTPFYFLKAGSLVKFETVAAAAGLIAAFLAVKMVTKTIGIWPLTKAFRFDHREGIYTTLMMSTGLTFGTISALFGLTNGIIDQDQYTVLVVAVIGSAVVPTLIAQKWFQPAFKELEPEPQPEIAEETPNA
ncbi:MAG: cation:proton antiporter [Rhodospirillales bacterium]|nr:cation:proton antiporter [Rhodospirillales bacterium]